MLPVGWTPPPLSRLPSLCPPASGLTSSQDKAAKAPGLQWLRLPGPSGPSPSPPPPPRAVGCLRGAEGGWTAERDAFPSTAQSQILRCSVHTPRVTRSHLQLTQFHHPAGAHAEPLASSPSLLFTLAASAFLDLAGCPRLLQLGIQSI